MRLGTMCIALAVPLPVLARQFWNCTARYNFQDLIANNDSDSVQLPSDTGRSSLTETFLPVFWLIEPTSGEVQFCAASPRPYAAAPG
jgi:hypothetical protein